MTKDEISRPVQLIREIEIKQTQLLALYTEATKATKNQLEQTEYYAAKISELQALIDENQRQLAEERSKGYLGEGNTSASIKKRISRYWESAS